MEYEYLTTLGQDSHRFEDDDLDPSLNSIILGGVDIPFDRRYSANSDGDVIYHALTNAVSGFTCNNILGGLADELCLEKGIKDSSVFLRAALDDLAQTGAKITHVSISVECRRPKLKEYIPLMRKSIGSILGIDETRVGLTATTGEGLTGPGRGEGIEVLALMTLRVPARD